MCYSRLVQISVVFCLLTVGIFSPAICPSPAVRCCRHSRVFASWRCLRVWCTAVWRLCRADSPCPSAPHNTGAASASITRYVVTNPPFQLTVAPCSQHGDCMWSVQVIAYGLCRCSVFVFCAGHILLFELFPSIPTFPYHGKASAYHANQHWTGHKVNTRLAWIYSDAFSA